jgi:hypothetical protein
MRIRLALAALALLLGGCTLYVRPAAFELGFGVVLTPVITQFQPLQGPGAVYYAGQPVQFLIHLTEPGYVTLVAVDPGGRAYEFDQLYLNAGTHILPPPGASYQYTVTPPTGRELVRAIYTNTPYPPGVRFSGRIYINGLNAQTSLYLRASGASIRDVADTYFYIVSYPY